MLRKKKFRIILILELSNIAEDRCDCCGQSAYESYEIEIHLHVGL